MQNFPFKQVLKKAWQLVKTNKLLWIIGIFVGSASMALDPPGEDWQGLHVDSVGQVLINVKNFLSNPLLALYALMVFVFFIAIVLASFWARVAMLEGIRKDRNGEKLQFGQLLKFGFGKMPRILLMEIILGVVNLILGVIIFFTSVVNQDNNFTLNIIFLIAVLALVIYNVVLFMFRHYAYCFAVLEDCKALPAIKSGWKLFRQNARPLIVVKLIEVGLWMAGGIAAIIILAVCTAPFLLLGLILMVVVGALAWTIVAMLAVIALIIVLLVISGVLNTFFQSYLTYAYWQVKK